MHLDVLISLWNVKCHHSEADGKQLSPGASVFEIKAERLSSENADWLERQGVTQTLLEEKQQEKA